MLTRPEMHRCEAGRMPRATDGRPAGVKGLSRLVQVALGLYLLPALLIVLVVGALGMIIVAVARGFAALDGRETWPPTPVGPGSLSHDTGFDRRQY